MPYPLPPDQQGLPFRGWVNLERQGEIYLIPMSGVFPAGGFETSYTTTGDVPSWADVSRWVAQQWDPNDTGQTTISFFQAVHLVEQFQIAALEALSGFFNLTVDYVDTVADRAQAALSDLDIVVGLSAEGLRVEIDQLRDATHAEIVILQQQAIAGDLEVAALIDQARNDAITIANQWARDNIYNPLQRGILETIQLLRDETDRKILEAIKVIRDEQTTTDTNIIKELARVGAGVKVATDWLSGIGNPMGDLFGPGTDAGNAVKDFEATNPGDLSKALGLLKSLLAILGGIALAGVTESQLEGWATTLATVAGDDFQTLVSGFAEGGGTIGDVAGTVLGDIGEGAADILRDLGVPIP
jgi:hypothetical protein